MHPYDLHTTDEEGFSLLAQTKQHANLWIGRENLHLISILFVGMYGCIGVLWFLYYLKKHTQAVQSLRTPLICISWASTSIGMTVLNKTLVTTLESPALVSGIQMAMAAVLVSAYTLGDRSIWNAVQARQVLTWLVVPFIFASILCSAAYTYRFISLSLQTVVRNLAPIVALPIEFFVMPAQKRPVISKLSVAAMILMLLGARMYTSTVGAISSIGLLAAFANLFLAVTDRITQRRLLTFECAGLPSLVCAILNNSLGIIPTLILSYSTQELSVVEAHASDWRDPRVLVLLALSGIIGIGICYVGFEAQRAISATSFFVLQNGTKVIIVIIGVTVFGDPIHSYYIILGLCLSFLGSLVYGKAQMDIKPSSEELRLVQKPESKA